MSLVFGAGESSSSLLLPTGFDVAWWLLSAAIAVMTIAALVRVLRSPQLTGTARGVWVLLILLLPPLGAVSAFLVVRSTSAQGRAQET